MISMKKVSAVSALSCDYGCVGVGVGVCVSSVGVGVCVCVSSVALTGTGHLQCLVLETKSGNRLSSIRNVDRVPEHWGS